MWESKVRPYQHKQVLQFGTKFDLGNPSAIYTANFSTHTNERKHFLKLKQLLKKQDLLIQDLRLL